MDEQERTVLANLVENNWGEFDHLADEFLTAEQRAELLEKLQVEDKD